MICPNEILLRHGSMGKRIKMGHKIWPPVMNQTKPTPFQ